ncbi:hypothetical protein [Acinetobacter pollinis]|uniref:hypothetical protein n=1 Tax=Acinetobacter pollinis TaxID=2605270 RepID=UPI0018C24A2A|nr:hypothetical protein [Acinetobacter pollinis]MBF7694152.1 hypothetical protein [Acinetobacter pollinis]MBF7701736.1 hypothetical protein [Acinetobacter pollinis]
MTQGLKESETCTMVSWAIMALGVIVGLVIILFFSRIEIPSMYSGTTKVWAPMMVVMGISAILNGLIVGYLFQKVASILKYHENKS